VKRVRELEGVLLRGEGGAVVVLVLVMLLLAGYNVVFRNVLMPLQARWATSGPPVSERARAEGGEVEGAEPTKADAKAKTETKDDDAGGFRGAFGAPADGETEGEEADEAEEAKAEPAKADEGDGAEDFGGAFGDDADEDEPEGDGAEDFGGAFGKNADDPEEDGAEGFGGAFGKAPDDGDPDEEEPEDDLDEQFANLPDIDTSRKVEDTGPKGGPPPPGSFAAWGVEAVDALRLDWIDVLLRQLVILASFLGAAMATARGKHINVDALSKILPPWVRRWTNVATNLLAVGVCLVLASAGWDLVALGREFPSELTPFLEEWHMQLMFPVGFGLLALHFCIRLTEGLLGLPGPGEETPAPVPTPAPAADAEKEDDA
jgi:TRAP-type C4-dicarboxylate transport system permease small subunit